MEIKSSKIIDELVRIEDGDFLIEQDIEEMISCPKCKTIYKGYQDVGNLRFINTDDENKKFATIYEYERDGDQICIHMCKCGCPLAVMPLLSLSKRKESIDDRKIQDVFQEFLPEHLTDVLKIKLS